jgi:4-hydroxythreonine-4-phosphate dehydrogenase
MSNTKPIIGITTGDLNGIGIELIIKSFAEHSLLEYVTPVIFASNKAIHFYKNIIGESQMQYVGTKDLTQLNPKQINIFTCWDEDVAITPGEMNELGGKYGIRSLMVATQCLKDGQIHGLVTNPIHKKNAQSSLFPYTGHTPYLKDTFGASEVVMMMCSPDTRVALLTEHIPLSDVSKHITRDAILQKVKIIHDSLVKDFGIDRPKIAVLGLNPHAGDDGLIGKEESDHIIPAITKLRNDNLLVFGPYPADGFFARQHDHQFDCVLAMYHDQGLIPFKSFDHGMGVNYTAGLPVVRTSPDHGTAFDIAGKNLAQHASFLEALFLNIDILRQREGYKENTKNRLQRGGTMGGRHRKLKEDVVE